MKIKFNKFRYKAFKKAVDLIVKRKNNNYYYWIFANDLFNKYKYGSDNEYSQILKLYNHINTKLIPDYYI